MRQRVKCITDKDGYAIYFSRGVLPQLVVREGRLVFALKVTQVAMKCLFRVDSVVMFVVVLISEKFTTVWASYLWS